MPVVRLHYFLLVVDEGLGVVAAKSLLSTFAERVSMLDKAVTKNVCVFALSRLLNRTVSFEDQVRSSEDCQCVLCRYVCRIL